MINHERLKLLERDTITCLLLNLYLTVCISVHGLLLPFAKNDIIQYQRKRKIYRICESTEQAIILQSTKHERERNCFH